MNAASLWCATAVGVLITVLFWRAQRRYLRLPLIPARRAGGTPPDCMAVIPARNEAGNIARAVRSLPADTVIVIDDHSEDRTAENAREAGAGVLQAPELPRGAVGKAHACVAGARVLTSRWVLFADADTSFEPGFLESMIGFAQTGGLAFLSVYLEPECETWTARMLVPLILALRFSGAGARSDAACLFNGQCVLVLREAYEFVGGHAAVLASVAEDASLAALAGRHRMQVAVARAPHLGRFRAPRTLREIGEGWSRQARRFSVLRNRAAAAVIVAAISLVLWLPALIWLAAMRHEAAAMALALVPGGLLWTWYRNPIRALVSPLAAWALLPVILAGFGAALMGREIEWKGRRI